MDTIYEIIEVLIPAECFTYDFMKNALLAVLIITPLFGMMGTLIVNNRMAFFLMHWDTPHLRGWHWG